MDESKKIPMARFNQLNKSQQIAALCAYHECKDKLRKVHHDQYVHRKWNPHPPERFIAWWTNGGARQTEQETLRAWDGIDAVRAFNCQAVRDVYAAFKAEVV